MYTRCIFLSPPLACERSVFTDAAMRFFRPRQTVFAIAALGFRCDPFAAVFRGAVHNRVALWIRLAGPPAVETLFERGLDLFSLPPCLRNLRIFEAEGPVLRPF